MDIRYHCTSVYKLNRSKIFYFDLGDSPLADRWDWEIRPDIVEHYYNIDTLLEINPPTKNKRPFFWGPKNRGSQFEIEDEGVYDSG